MFAPVAMSLAALTSGIAAYDHKHRRISNRITLTLLIGFMVVNFPGAAEVWLGCALLLMGWYSGWIGGGDAKLWMALLWSAPGVMSSSALRAMLLSFILTGILQIFFRALHKQEITGVRSPGAWRAIPYTIWLTFMSLNVH